MKKQIKMKLIDKYSESEVKTRKFVRVLSELHYILTRKYCLIRSGETES